VGCFGPVSGCSFRIPAVTPLLGIRAVSFDVGGTLIEPFPSVGAVYAAVARKAGLTGFTPESLDARFTAAWRAKVRFDYSREAWANLVAAAFGGPPERFGVGSPLFAQIYDRFTQADAWRVFEDVRPILQQLRRAGLKLAIISNWDDRLRPLLRNLQLDQFFPVFEVSAESGIQKPAAGIFERAIAKLGLPSGEVLHVGDSELEDAAGARQAKLKGVLLRRSAMAGRRGEIRSLAELAGLLGLE
jgi:putative hydrolase of the HAD superfamily